MNTHFFRLREIKPQRVYEGGSRTSVTVKELPLLKHLSLAVLKIKAGCLREPHWHPNAHELGYCVRGEGMITLFGPDALHETFTIKEGEVFFVPMGITHYIANTGEGELEILIAYTHEAPEDIDLSRAVMTMPEQVMEETLGMKIKKPKEDVFLARFHDLEKPSAASLPSRFKLNLEGMHPQIDCKGGYAKLARQNTLSNLDKIALFSLVLFPKGSREPHWHPNAYELNVVLRGKARVTIVSPEGKPDVMELEEGDGSFIPPSYLHCIENCGRGDMHMAVFFSHEAPSDVGISGSMGAYSNNTLSSVLHASFKEFIHPQEDRFIVTGGG